MTGYLDRVQREAEQAIAAMREAALAARQAHAHAELLRHLLTTTRKQRHLGKDDAVDGIVHEWLAAWHLEPGAWPEVAREMAALTAAFYDYVQAPSAETDNSIAEAYSGLRQCIAADGVTLEDHMAWRSRCAHGWWGDVRPAPPKLRRDPAMPQTPFWSKSCPADCA
jgi:hypothetical protein